MSMVEELKRVVDLGRTPIGDGNGSEYKQAALTFLRDHGQALVEAVADADRYRWLKHWQSPSRIEIDFDGTGHYLFSKGMLDSVIDTARTKVLDGVGL